MGNYKTIEFDNLSFTYQDETKSALNALSLEVGEGDYVAWMGHTGAGKSTLLYCLNALIPGFIRGKLEGKARVLGRDIQNSRTSEMFAEVGLVFQDFEAQLFSTSVELEIAFVLENQGTPRHVIKDTINEILSIMRLDKLRNREPSTLSGGEKQRLAIASVLAMHPRLLAMDEPTTDLDPLSKTEIFRLAKKFKREDRTIILVEHETEEVLNADKVVLFKEGRLLHAGTCKETLSDCQLLLEAGVMPLQVTEFFSRFRKPFEPKNAILPLTVEEGILEFRGKYKLKSAAAKYLDQKDSKQRNKKTGKTALKVEEVSYNYPSGIKALKGINLEIQEGEFVAIIGQNGSGKTTLAKMFNSLLRPTTGCVKVFGETISKLTIRDLAEKVGYVFQNPDHQIFASTVFEEIAFGPRNFGMCEKAVKRNVEEALTSVNLLGYEEQDPFMLTKGERQRVAVASVLAVKPQVIILDEPTTGLDYLQQQSMMNMISSLNQKGHTVVIITHSMSTVAKYAHRIIVLDGGQVLMDDTTRKVFSREAELEKVSLRPPQIARFGNCLGVTPLTVEEMIEVTEFLD